MKLDDKTRGLVAVSAAVGAGCLPCFRWHYRNCIKLGVDMQLLNETIELALIIKGMPNKIFNENIKKIIHKCNDTIVS